MEERRSKERVMTVEIYTDGSLKKSGQTMTFGGWAFIVTRDGREVYSAAGSEEGTTNQRMELQAIREALKYISAIRRPSEKVVIYSDSAYAINCYTQDWYVGWQSNGWLNAKKEPVANQDLWTDIVPYFDNFWYDFRKVDGHSGVYWNEECDARAQTASEALRKTWKGINNETKRKRTV